VFLFGAKVTKKTLKTRVLFKVKHLRAFAEQKKSAIIGDQH
jgi:hypothetical protein